MGDCTHHACVCACSVVQRKQRDAVAQAAKAAKVAKATKAAANGFGPGLQAKAAKARFSSSVAPRKRDYNTDVCALCEDGGMLLYVLRDSLRALPRLALIATHHDHPSSNNAVQLL